MAPLVLLLSLFVMPGPVRGAVSAGILPYSLSTKFSESHAVQAIVNEYHDGSSQRKSLVSEGRRTWNLSKHLTAAQLTQLRNFAASLQGGAFYFYNPQETLPPFSNNPIGTSGQYLVRFNSDWSQTNGMVRSDSEIQLIEVTAQSEDIPVVTVGGSGSGGGAGGTPQPPATGSASTLTISDQVNLTGTAEAIITNFSGKNGAFVFSGTGRSTKYRQGDYYIFQSEDRPPGPGYIVSVGLSTFSVITGNNPEIHLTAQVSLTGDQAVPIYTFSHNFVGVAGQPPISDNTPVVATLWPPIQASTPPTFAYNVTDGTVSSSVSQYAFYLSVVEVGTFTSLRVGWPKQRYFDTDPPFPSAPWHVWGFMGSLWDDILSASGIEVAQPPLEPWPVVATQDLSFSSVTLRLLGMSAYSATGGTQPTEIGLGGETATVKVVTGNGAGTYTETLGASAVTINLGSPVSVTTGSNIITIQVISSSDGWFNNYLDANQADPSKLISTPPYPLIEVTFN